MGLFNHKQKNVFLNMGGRLVPVTNKKEAEFYAQQFLKHCTESVEIVNHTKNPRVYFERYNFILENTNNLIQLEGMLKFNNTLPSVQLQKLLESKEESTNLMIARCFDDLNNKISKLKTDKTKINNIQKVYDELSFYENEMTSKNIDLCNRYYKTFMSNF